MEKKKLLQTVAIFGLATLLLSSFTGTVVNTDPFIQKIKTQLQIFSHRFSEEKVYLQLDRNFYKPKDIIWYSAWIRNANTLRADDVSEQLYLELIDPKGTVLEKQTVNAQRGLGDGGIKLNTQKGGLYKIKAYTKWQENTNTFFEREIQVQDVVLPNLKMKLDFDRKAYGAGDEVVAKLEAKDLEDQLLRLRDFSYLISLDGKRMENIKMKMDFDGKAEVKFTLPETLKSRDGLLQILIPHNGQTESISRAIPITLKKIDLQFFPEGGKLVAGLSSKVAFKAVNEFGKPADIEGVILNKKGEEVASFKSFHNGMGATKLWPERGGTYRAKITKPAGINRIYELPEVALRGLQMSVSGQNKKGLRVKIQATRAQPFHLLAQANDKVLFAEASTVDKDKVINIETKNFPMGITRLSLFDEAGSVVSERLVFVNPHKQLNINIKTDKKQYQPREKVTMDIFVKDHNGKPMIGNFALAVADDKLLTFADDKQGHILSKLFLESELKGSIEEPDFYFDPKEEKAIAALDYLMMTQGWRRYDWKEVRSDELIAFENLKEQSWISGRVVDGKNQAVEGAKVSILGEDIKTETNEQGYFVIEDLELGEIGPVMKISHEGLPTIRKSIVEYKRDYHIVMAKKTGSIAGLLLLPSDKEARYATVEIYNDNGNRWTAYTDKNGEYIFHQLKPGAYTLNFKHHNLPSYQIEKVMVWPSEKLLLSRQFLREGSQPKVITEKMATATMEKEISKLLQQKKEARIGKEQKVVEASFSQEIVRGAVNMDEIMIVDYKVPMVSQDNTTQGAIITSEDIRKFASKNILSIAASTAGMSQVDEGDGISVRGSRSNALDVYVDGIRVSASTVQEADVEQLQVITGGIPACYGGTVYRLPERKVVGVFKNKKEEAVYHHRESVATTSKNFFVGGGASGGSSSSGRSYYSGSRRPSKIYTLVDKQARIVSKKCKEGMSESDCYECANEELMERVLAAVTNSYTWKRYGHTNDATLEFFVNKKGEVGGVEVKVNGSNYYIKREIQRALSKFKKWEPARIKNKKVASRVVIPIPAEGLMEKRITQFQQMPTFYSPKYLGNMQVQNRVDFRSTVFWKPDVKTDENGKASVTFWNSDDITSFEARLEGISNNGFAGAATHTYSVQSPFNMSAKMPVVLLEGDEVKVPITLSNNTDETIEGQLEMKIPDCFVLKTNSEKTYSLMPNENRTIYPVFKVVNNAKTKAIQKSNISFLFSSGKFIDGFSQLVRFQSDGYPISKVFTGTELNNEFTLDVKDLRNGSMKTQLLAHPNITGDFLATSERMLRQPGGCFEQTSSSNYPNVLVAQYLRNHGGQIKRDLIKKADEFMLKGYNRLTGYEVNGGGFEWFGNDPAHEALTAYGILQFTDMAKVFPVNKEMIDRTVSWLLERRDKQGGWLPGKKGLHRWVPSPLIRNAYISWALSAAGYGEEIEKEINSSYSKAINSDDAYLLALVANTLLEKKDKRADKILDRLLDQCKNDGSFKGATYSITNSNGQNLTLETTGLAMLAFLAADNTKYEAAIVKGMKFITNAKSRTGYGSTQATVLCLKAALAYAEKSNKKPKKGQIALYINDKLIEEKSYNSTSQYSIAFNGFSKHLKEGSHKVEVRFAGADKPIPFELMVDYAAALPENNTSTCKLALATHLSDSIIQQGQSARLTTTISNKTEDIVTSPIAIVGIPAGLSPQPWQLKQLQKENEFAYYEVLDNKVIFYLYELKPNEERNINLDLKADIPGRYLGPASHAYLYYENDVADWVAPQKVTVEAMN